MRKALAIWLAISVVVIGIWLPTFLHAYGDYKEYKAYWQPYLDAFCQYYYMKGYSKSAACINAAKTVNITQAPDPWAVNQEIDLKKNRVDGLIIIGYAYPSFSIAYWIIIWGFRKRSIKPGEVDTGGSGKNISA
ncbi:hypothetical protein MTAT_14160 [Moorella thermoacetica]|uniref:Uncharacterized protein n=1 Tax=Neomoorella thermoacetica TaxID=1525 RepID=A0AAC9HHP6_NEOTH|nr:hypothetical protein [Moorella thermoacetica]AOQ23831.1 hypothetical protein Maut_01383 [Moorella thermoacetica]TYL14016.1 hypothetical protein MTAT_14160 [Moorella thermoacetica]